MIAKTTPKIFAQIAIHKLLERKVDLPHKATANTNTTRYRGLTVALYGCFDFRQRRGGLSTKKMKQYLKETLPLESETERKRQRMVLTENFLLFCFAQNLFSLCARAAGEYMPILKPGNFKLVDGGEHDG